MSEELMDTKALSRWSKMSIAFWNRRRCSGDGPPYLKCSRKVLYRRTDVEAWLDQMQRAGTKITDGKVPGASLE